MSEVKVKDIIPSGQEREKQPVARHSVELKDTPENRKRVKEVVDHLAKAIETERANIGFGVGLRDGKIVIKADNLDLLPPRKRKK